MGQVRRDPAASPQVRHRGCKFAVSGQDSKLHLRRDGDLPREQKGLESIGCSFWELLPLWIQLVDLYLRQFYFYSGFPSPFVFPPLMKLTCLAPIRIEKENPVLIIKACEWCRLLLVSNDHFSMLSKMRP